MITFLYIKYKTKFCIFTNAIILIFYVIIGDFVNVVNNEMIKNSMLPSVYKLQIDC